MKEVMINSQPAKNRNEPYWKWHKMLRKACAITNVIARFVDTTIACPAERISMGKISLGTNHPSGPQDHANAETKVEMKNRTRLPSPLESTFVPPNFVPNMTAIAICQFQPQCK